MKFYLYVHSNRINGKKYVGITKQRPEKRWMKGRGYQGQKKFYSAILKYGWDNFDHQVWELSSEKDMLYGEMYLIKFYNTIKDGYNVSPGGKWYQCGYKNPKCPIHRCNYDSDADFHKAYYKWIKDPRSKGILPGYLTQEEELLLYNKEITVDDAWVIYISRIKLDY